MRHVIAVALLAAAVTVLFIRRDSPRGVPAGDSPPIPRAAPCDARVQRETPCFTPFDTKPQLRNGKEVQAAMMRSYPRYLSERGVEGTAHLFVLIDDSGKVQNALINRSSGVAGLDSAALSVAEDMVFSPARNDGRETWAWFEVPFAYRAK